jgi:hypothetical protein
VSIVVFTHIELKIAEMMSMKLTVLLTFLTSVVNVNAQQYDVYAGYTPTTSITDFAAIDLDQEIVNEQTGERALLNAWNVYKDGGHSGSYAELEIEHAHADVDYKAGMVVRGMNSFNDIVNGTLLEPVKWTKGTLSPIVKVVYDTLPLQSEYNDCQVGGLFTFQAAERGGCTFITPFF